MGRRVDTWFIFQWSVWAVIVALSGLTLVYVLGVLLNAPWFEEVPRAAPLIEGEHRVNNLVLLGHLITAVPCIVFGWLLFLPNIRKRHARWHRWIGTVYVFTVLPSAVVGFILASVNTFGWGARSGFMVLAVVWFSTTWIMYRAARGKNFVIHRRWAVRSYSISLAVVLVRFLGTPEGFTREEWYPLMTWLCWVPNIILAEIYVRITDFKGRLTLARTETKPGVVTSGAPAD